MYIAVGALILAVLAMLVYRVAGDRLGLIDRSKPGEYYHTHPGFIRVKNIMMVVVSLLVLGSALYVILSQAYEDATQKWAFGAVGSIIGFWLRAEEA